MVLSSAKLQQKIRKRKNKKNCCDRKAGHSCNAEAPLPLDQACNRQLTREKILETRLPLLYGGMRCAVLEQLKDTQILHTEIDTEDNSEKYYAREEERRRARITS